MKKYKLIKEYPHHTIGDIAIVDYKTYCYWEKDRSNIYDPFLPGSSDWFEEIPEPDYIIRSFLNYDVIIYLHLNGYYSYTESTSGRITLDSMLSITSAKIYSVERKKDGTIFTIGDYIKAPNSPIKGHITLFEINSDNEIIIYTDYANIGLNISALYKSTEPELLFITEDKVKIYDGDSYVTIDKSSQSISSGYHAYCPKESYLNNPDVIYFSSLSKAEEYLKTLIDSVVLFTTVDGKKIHFGDTYSWVRIHDKQVAYNCKANGTTSTDYNIPNLAYFSTEEGAKNFFRKYY